MSRKSIQAIRRYRGNERTDGQTDGQGSFYRSLFPRSSGEKKWSFITLYNLIYIKQTIRFRTGSGGTKLFPIIFPLFSPLPDFIPRKSLGSMYGKMQKMMVSANQSCPFGYFSRHPTQTTVNRRGMK